MNPNQLKTAFDNLYCKLPLQIIEALAPQSNLYEIQQGQQYSQTKFENPTTGKTLSYSNMLELYRSRRIVFSASGYEPSVTYTFEEFINPYITKK